MYSNERTNKRINDGDRMADSATEKIILCMAQGADGERTRSSSNCILIQWWWVKSRARIEQKKKNTPRYEQKQNIKRDRPRTEAGPSPGLFLRLLFYITHTHTYTQRQTDGVTRYICKYTCNNWIIGENDTCVCVFVVRNFKGVAL